MGEEEEKLPDTGHNIQISYLVKDMKDGELFSTMTSELQYVFPIVNGVCSGLSWEIRWEYL